MDLRGHRPLIFLGVASMRRRVFADRAPPRRRRDARVDFRAAQDASPTSRVRIRLPCSTINVLSAVVTSMEEPGSRLVT